MKYLSFFFKKTGALSKRFFDKISRMLYHPKPSVKDEGANEFYRSGGEQLRFDYPGLNTNSIVFDLGGYEGQWASDIYGRYRSKIYIFEVYAPYYDNIKERFSNNDDIKVYNFGLSSGDAVTQISIDGFSTSAFKKSENMVDIELRNVSHFISENKIKKIDLMKINIEGAEYELLEHLISTGIVKTIDNLQIQFHEFIPNAFNEMNSIREKLSVTHLPTYKFDFTWDNWKLKE